MIITALSFLQINLFNCLSEIEEHHPEEFLKNTIELYKLQTAF